MGSLQHTQGRAPGSDQEKMGSYVLTSQDEVHVWERILVIQKLHDVIQVQIVSAGT